LRAWKKGRKEKTGVLGGAQLLQYFLQYSYCRTTIAVFFARVRDERQTDQEEGR